MVFELVVDVFFEGMDNEDVFVGECGGLVGCMEIGFECE